MFSSLPQASGFCFPIFFVGGLVGRLVGGFTGVFIFFFAFFIFFFFSPIFLTPVCPSKIPTTQYDVRSFHAFSQVVNLSSSPASGRLSVVKHKSVLFSCFNVSN